METDKKDCSVPCFDCCFHPKALELASRVKAFRDLLVTTAIDGVESQYKKQGQQVT